MNNFKPDAVIKVKFKRPDEGGRKQSPSGEFYGCVLFVNSDAYECRLLLHGRSLELGVEHEVPVKFLSPAAVLPKLFPGLEIRLWEGREVATGKVVSLTA